MQVRLRLKWIDGGATHIKEGYIAWPKDIESNRIV